MPAVKILQSEAVRSEQCRESCGTSDLVFLHVRECQVHRTSLRTARRTSTIAGVRLRAMRDEMAEHRSPAFQAPAPRSAQRLELPRSPVSAHRLQTIRSGSLSHPLSTLDAAPPVNSQGREGPVWPAARIEDL